MIYIYIYIFLVLFLLLQQLTFESVSSSWRGGRGEAWENNFFASTEDICVKIVFFFSLQDPKVICLNIMKRICILEYSRNMKSIMFEFEVFKFDPSFD